MSRWSLEEDSYIMSQLELHHEVGAKEFDYTWYCEDHNHAFNTKRTEVAYKARVQKIAKEKGIQIKTGRLTEEDKQQIVSEIQSNPYNVNWHELSEKYQRTDAYLRTLYNEHVSCTDHIETCMMHLSDHIINDVKESLVWTCTSCHQHFYSTPKEWELQIYCDVCYTKQFSDVILQRWKEVEEYAHHTQKDHCAICKKTAQFNRMLYDRFHFDHINMFEKENSICSMVQNGSQINEIYREMDSCQILCISCHKLVTAVEVRSGFTRLKQVMTRQRMSEPEKKQEYAEKYQTFMMQIYERLRKNLLTQTESP